MTPASVMQKRYSSINQALHWFAALCMFAILPLAWVMTNVRPGTPLRATLFSWHETLGLVVLFVTGVRLVWRMFDGPPPYHPQVARWERVLAHTTAGLLFLMLLWMPITGFFTASYGGHRIRLFNLIPTPAILPRVESQAKLFDSLHLFGQWAVYGLIALHLSAVAFHLIWDKNGVLGRMLPAHATEPKEAQASDFEIRARMDSGVGSGSVAGSDARQVDESASAQLIRDARDVDRDRVRHI
jgi:cytochrome b561